MAKDKDVKETKDGAEQTEALWAGRFDEMPDDFFTEFGASLPVDYRMWHEDMVASMAHAAMLAKQGIVTEEEADAIIGGLEGMLDDMLAGGLDFDIADEDIHMAVERELTRRIGEVA